MKTRGELVAQRAPEWIGVPAVPQGRVRAGCDCKGLVAGIAAELGFPEAQSLEALAGDYGNRIDCPRLRRGLATLFDRVSEIEPGDVLLLVMGGKPQHLGVALDARRMVHCHVSGPAQVVEGAIGRGRLDSIWRWKESFSGPAEEPDRGDRTNVRPAASMPPVTGLRP